MSCICSHFSQPISPALEKLLSLTDEQVNTCCRICTKQSVDGYLCLTCGKFFCGGDEDKEHEKTQPPHFIQHYADMIGSKTLENSHSVFVNITTGVIICLECDMPIYSYEILDDNLRARVTKIRSLIKKCKNNFMDKQIQSEQIYTDIQLRRGEPVFVQPVVASPSEYCFDSLARMTQESSITKQQSQNNTQIEAFQYLKQSIIESKENTLDFMADIIDREAVSSHPPVCLEPSSCFLRYSVPQNNFLTALISNFLTQKPLPKITINPEICSTTAMGKAEREMAIKKANEVTAKSGGANITALLDMTQIREKILEASEKYNINLEFKPEAQSPVVVDITPEELKETLEELQKDRIIKFIYQKLTSENAKALGTQSNASLKKLAKTSNDVYESTKSEFPSLNQSLFTVMKVQQFITNPLVRLGDVLKKKVQEQGQSKNLDKKVNPYSKINGEYIPSEAIAPQDYGAEQRCSASLDESATSVDFGEIHTFKDSSSKALNLMNRLVSDSSAPGNKSREVQFSTELKMDIGFTRNGSKMKVHGIPKNLKFKSQYRYTNLLLAHDLQVSDSKESYKDALICYVKGDTPIKRKNIKEKDEFTTYIKVDEIDNVREGANGGGFMRNRSAIEDSTACFTCVTHFGDLELEAPNRDSRDSWVRSLNFIISKLKAKN